MRQPEISRLPKSTEHPTSRRHELGAKAAQSPRAMLATHCPHMALMKLLERIRRLEGRAHSRSSKIPTPPAATFESKITCPALRGPQQAATDRTITERLLSSNGEAKFPRITTRSPAPA